MRTIIAILLVLGCSYLCAQPTPKVGPVAGPPQVVFIGDYVTYNWDVNVYPYQYVWQNEGESEVDYVVGDSAGTLQRFQANVVALHPKYVHIMVGLVDEEQLDDAVSATVTQNLLANVTAMVKAAKAANIQVILGLEPGGWSPENAVIAAYGAANNITVVSYENVPMDNIDLYTEGSFTPTPEGYAQMTATIESVIATMGAKLQGGYLQNTWTVQGGNVTPQSGTNINTISSGQTLQFSAVGYYANGVVQTQLNTNLVGASGTWTSSNPEVMYVGPTGTAWALSPGQAAIKYTSLNGVAFSEWIMYVTPGID